MIRKNPCHDPSAGCYSFEKPLVKSVEEYTQEAHKIALQEAFKEGERVGYLRGLKQRTEALNPSSENLR